MPCRASPRPHAPEACRPHCATASCAPAAAQRETLARGNASLDRALDVLIPSEPTGLYGAGGKAERRSVGGGSYQA
jgi:hypothetical protein